MLGETEERRAGSSASRTAVLTAAALLVVAVCVSLGLWQWSRGHVVVDVPPATRPVAAVEQVVDAGAAAGSARAVLSRDEVGARVRVSGTFDPAVDLLVPARPLQGRQGSWVLGVVRLADGSGLPVVRGWVPEGAAAPAPPAGPVELSGVVQPPEGSDVAPSTAALPAGQVWFVSAADLVNRVDYPVANAYVTDTAPAAGLRAVPPADPGEARRRLDWGNIAYAAQWWVFAVFAVVVWGRAVRDGRADAGEDVPEEAAVAEGAAEGDGGRDMSGTR
ncbi:SURF1 family protein [Kineococcus sp. T13]|uniref:SURF1 family cytochrome oxidase biogenesis protein n=1 Tax=Kineococcus vitellinus TaxID=2696565 RepID=UPI0014120AC4|nr:SURF1 family protein [Kineococcus vitellinus]